MNYVLLTLVIALSPSVICSVRRPLVGIIQGTPAHDGEYPSTVSIQENGSHLCGGNIINEHTILTAAHCTIGRETATWEAIAGITDLESAGPNLQKYKIVNVIVHPKFEMHSSLFDIAIATVEHGFVFNSFVNSIRLYSSPDAPEKAVIVGWGAVTESGPTSSILLKTTIAIETKAECEAEYGDEMEFGLLCAKTNHGDACRGDSGGPLICDSNELCGIISSGQGCGRENESALYIDVSYFVDWIDGSLSEDSVYTLRSSDNYNTSVV